MTVVDRKCKLHGDTTLLVHNDHVQVLHPSSVATGGGSWSFSKSECRRRLTCNFFYKPQYISTAPAAALGLFQSPSVVVVAALVIFFKVTLCLGWFSTPGTLILCRWCSSATHLLSGGLFHTSRRQSAREFNTHPALTEAGGLQLPGC